MQEMSERLLDVKTKSESDAIVMQKLTEDIQKYEDENRTLSENNSILHVDFYYLDKLNRATLTL